MRQVYSIVVILLGIISVVFQVLLMRETASIFSGNELIFGLVLSIWLLTSGLGYLSAKRVRCNVKWLFALTAVLPLATLLAMRLLTSRIFVRGALVAPTQMYGYLFLVMLPFCFLNGFLIIAIAGVFPIRDKSQRTGMVILLDNAGDMLGGLIFSFVLVYTMNSSQMVLVLLVVGMLGAMFIAVKEHSKPTALLFAFSLAALVALFFVFDIEKVSLSNQYRGQQIVENRFTPYGNLVLTKTGSEYNLFENGVLYATTGNPFRAEQVVHYAMLNHPNPKSVLLISGGISGTVKETQKYNISHLDYVELDPEAIRLGEIYLGLPEGLQYHFMDGRRFLATTNKKYDVIIVDLPGPTSAQLNRFYTLEFFRLAKQRLNKNGVLSFHLPGGENYITTQIADLNSIVASSVARFFKHIIVVPGETVYYIVSDNNLSYDYVGLLKGKGINTSFVNEGYLGGILTKDRLDSFFSSVKITGRLNRDLKPVAYIYMLKQWLKQFNTGMLPILLLLGGLFCVYLWRPGRVSFAVFTTGLSGISIEFVLILVFQVMYGYVYSQLGLLVALFMVGLLIGTRSMLYRNVKSLFPLDFGVFMYTLLLGLLLSFGGFIPSTAIYILTALIGALVGAEFLTANKLCMTQVRSTLSSMYFADTMGSAVGALATSILLVPLLGIPNTLFVLAGLKVISMSLLPR